LSSNPRIALAGKVRRLGKSFEESLYNMVRLRAIQKFKVQVAAGFVRESLEEFACQAEPKSRRHILPFFAIGDFLKLKLIQTAPNEVRASAEVDHASGEAFVHRDVGFGFEGS